MPIDIGDIDANGSIEVARVARLDHTLRYQGSMHDKASAKRFGFAGAIVPGVYLHGFMTQLVVPAWGHAWLTRGLMRSRSRRPIYDGDPVTVSATNLRQDAAGSSVDLAVRDAGGIDIALGHAALPNAASAMPDPEDHPVLPTPETPPLVTAGGMKVGMRFSSVNQVLTPEEHRQSLADFGETWPGYFQEGIVHPGLLLRLGMRDTIASYRYPTPGLYVSSETRFLGLAHVGDRISSSGQVIGAYERKGHHYFESEQVLFANRDRPVARITRVSIYAAREMAA